MDTWVNPVVGRVSSPAGIRYSPITGTREFHDGVDIAVPVGTAIAAPRDGEVIARGYSASFGWFVRVCHGYYQTFFAHLSSVPVAVGDVLQQGERVAYSGNTGWSTAPHLHFGLFRAGQFVDPIKHFCFTDYEYAD